MSTCLCKRILDDKSAFCTDTHSQFDMIHHVSGTISHKAATFIVVDTAGIGRIVHTPSSFAETCSVGDTLTVLTTLVVREDALDLYGFESSSQRDLFGLLTSISGIGPRTAIGILSAVSIGDFVAFVRQEEAGKLQKLPGIGKKTAERLILELRDKVHGLVTGSSDSSTTDDPSFSTVGEESVLALIALGYTKAAAKKAVAAALKSSPDASVETVIRLSFSYLMK